MKIEEELKEWFWDMFNSCYIFKHDERDRKYLYYDENFIRQAKLKTILDEEIIYPKNATGTCLFIIDSKNKLFYVNDYKIIDLFELCYDKDLNKMKILIDNWLSETEDLKHYNTVLLKII